MSCIPNIPRIPDLGELFSQCLGEGGGVYRIYRVYRDLGDYLVTALEFKESFGGREAGFVHRETGGVQSAFP